MTYGELKTKVLNLIFSYSIAGDEIELSYDNQADYVNMIPPLLSSVQAYIYQIKKIRDSILLKDLEVEDLGETYLYHLPDDCMKVVPGVIIPRGAKHGPVFQRRMDYKLFGGTKMLVPKDYPENAILEYEKRAVPIPQNVPDNYVLKNTEEVNEIIPFYIAAFVVMHDDAFKYAALYNEFETRLQRLQTNPPYVEINEVFDVYGGFDGPEYGYYGGYY